MNERERRGSPSGDERETEEIVIEGAEATVADDVDDLTSAEDGDATVATVEEDLDDAEDEFVEDGEDDEYEEVGVVRFRRGPFLALAGLAALAIIGLAAATGWLLYDRQSDEEPVVAIVNGEKIRRGEYDTAVASGTGDEVLDNLILEHLIMTEAAQRQLQISDERVLELLDEQKKRIGGDAEYQAALAQAGLTEQQLSRQLRLSEMLRLMVADQVQITEAEVATEYEATKAQYPNQTLDQARPQVTEQLKSRKENTVIRAFLEDLRGKATIEKFLPGKAS